MSTWYATVEVTVSSVYTKVIKVERPPLWDPSDLGKPLEGEDQIDVNNRLLSDDELANLVGRDDLKLYKQTPETDYRVLSISAEGKSV